MNSDFLGLYISIDDLLITFGIMSAIMLILFILLIVNMCKTGRLRKRYESFMQGKDAQSLEETLSTRIQQIDQLVESEKKDREDIEKIFQMLLSTFQKVGMVKYDAFHEMGGKLSFSLALLDQKNDGIIINAMHSREGCYTYIKEIVNGNSIIVLAEEEAEALNIALGKNVSEKN